MNKHPHQPSARPATVPPDDIAGSSLSSLFPDADFRHQMRFTRGPVDAFFGSWGQSASILAERRHWLETDPAGCAALRPSGEPLLAEMVECLAACGVLPAPPALHIETSSLGRLIQFGKALEPDFLLLRPDDDGQPRLVGACVCFPSAWSLDEKMGQTLDFIHSVVPQLNEQLANPIAGFLRRMTPGIAWQRANWGLSRSAELNLHPKRGLPRLDATVTPGEVWLRVEHQALVALPRTQGVLFGIRVLVHPLAEVMRDAGAATGLQRALQTMPEDMARYKGIATARAKIVEWLSASRSTGS